MLLLMLACTPEPTAQLERPWAASVSFFTDTSGPRSVLEFGVDFSHGDRTWELNYAEPVIEMDGEEIDVIAVAYQGRVRGWASEEGFAPGEYEMVAAYTEAGRRVELDPMTPFTIEATAGPDFRPEPGLYQTDAMDGPSPVIALLTDSMATWLEIVEVDGDDVDFRVIVDSGSGTCVAFDETGWMADGELRWRKTDHTTEFVEPEPLELHNLWLRLPFSEDGSAILAGAGQMDVDSRPLTPLVEGGSFDSVCELIQGFGEECVDCPEGEPLCIDLRLHNLELSRVEVGLGELEMCSADLEDEQLSICSTLGVASGGASLWWLAAALLRRRPTQSRS